MSGESDFDYNYRVVDAQPLLQTSAARPAPLPGPVQAALVGALLLLAAAAWALTDSRMDGMDAGPGTELGGLGWFVVVWVTMMAAMMLPSLAPTVLAYARIREPDRGRGWSAGTYATTTVFVAGYLLVWAAAGLVAYLLVEGVRSLDLGFLAWDEAGPYVAGGVILVAALYQLTGAKDLNLSICREPRALLDQWQGGPTGALRMGMEHGGRCVGCCWAFMAVLFAVGVMSVGWMVFVAALIAVEKLLPWRTLASRAIAVLLLALALAVAFAPEDVPGLTIPSSPEAGPAMDMMEME